MEKIYLAYKTDVHHSYASRDLIGVSHTHLGAAMLCGQQADKEGELLSPESFGNLMAIKQTQEYSGEGEYVIEEVEIDELL